VADDRAQPATVVLGAPERRRQNVAEVAVPAAQPLLVRLGQGGEVTVDAGQHAGAGPVEPVQVGQAGAQPGSRVADFGPGAGVGSCCWAIQCAEHAPNSASSSGRPDRAIPPHPAARRLTAPGTTPARSQTPVRLS
jgi:hypothetical protein